MFKRVMQILLLTALCSFSAYAVVGGGDVTFKVEGEHGSVKFSHEDHVVDAEMKCTDCHDKLYLDTKNHKKVTCRKEMVKKKSCGACHDGKKAELDLTKSCVECHEKK